MNVRQHNIPKDTFVVNISEQTRNPQSKVAPENSFFSLEISFLNSKWHRRRQISNRSTPKQTIKYLVEEPLGGMERRQIKIFETKKKDLK